MKYSVKSQVLVGLCVALVAIFSQITIPVPFSMVPITFQTFAVILVAIMIEDRLATYTLIVYTLLGCIGLPVFSGFSGGVPRIFGPTGGFIIGFILMAFIIGQAAKRKNKVILWMGTYVGLVIDYILGVIQLSFVAHMTLKEAIMVGAVPFIIKDFILAAIAIIIATRIKELVRKAGMSLC